MVAITTYNGGWILDDDDPAGPGGNAIQDTLKRLLTVIDCTDFGTGTISLGAYNYTIGAANTIDGRDLSVDGAKLDGIEAAADVTDAANVAGAGAAMAGGAFHDGFSDFVAAEHMNTAAWAADLIPDGGGTRNLGSVLVYWNYAYFFLVSTASLSVATSVISDLIPNNDSTYDLGVGGGTPKRWAELHVDDIEMVGALTGAGSGHDQFSDYVAYEHTNWVTGTSCAQHFATSGYAAIGNDTASSAYRLLVLQTSPNASKYGVHLDFVSSATTNGTYNPRGLSLDCEPQVDNGVTASGTHSVIRAECLGVAGLAGTLANIHGFNFILGHNTGTTGTTNAVNALKITPYHKAGTIDVFRGLWFSAPQTGGTLTASWALYDETGWNSYHKGNFGIGSAQVPSANGGKVLFLGDNGAQPTMGTNTAGLYGYDSGSTTVELWAADELGNDTQLSSHPFGDKFKPDADEPLPYAIHHRNQVLGRGQYIDVSKMARFLEDKFHVKLVHDYDLPVAASWDQVQADRKAAWERHEKERRIEAAISESETEIDEAEAIELVEVPQDEAIEVVELPARVVYQPALQHGQVEMQPVFLHAKTELRLHPDHTFDEVAGKFHRRRVRDGCERIGKRWVKRLTREEARAQIEQPVYVPKPLPEWIAERLTQ